MADKKRVVTALRLAAMRAERLAEPARLRSELEQVRRATEEVRRYLESTMPDGAAAEIMRPFDATRKDSSNG